MLRYLIISVTTCTHPIKGEDIVILTRINKVGEFDATERHCFLRRLQLFRSQLFVTTLSFELFHAPFAAFVEKIVEFNSVSRSSFEFLAILAKHQAEGDMIDANVVWYVSDGLSKVFIIYYLINENNGK